jgi:hypothetical protein
VKGKEGTGERPENRGRRSINREVFVFAFFLLLSFIFWYLNSLDKEVESGVRYPVRFTNIPRSRSVVDKEPARLNLYLKGPGSSILKLKLWGKRGPVSVDLSKVSYRRVPGSKDLNYYILTSSLARSFTVQLRSQCEVTAIKPDTLYFTIGNAEVSPAQQSEKRAFFRKEKKQS